MKRVACGEDERGHSQHASPWASKVTRSFTPVPSLIKQEEVEEEGKGLGGGLWSFRLQQGECEDTLGTPRLEGGGDTLAMG